MATVTQPPKTSRNLRRNCLSYPEAMAQSISVIAPSPLRLSTLCGFAIFGQMLLAQLGIHLHVLAIFAMCVIVSFGVAYKDSKLSATVMLIFEGLDSFHPGLGRCYLGA
jgi:hypothetical protein